MSDSMLGRTLDEYRLEELLGKGGMARVYRGFDTRLRRYVAIKVIDAPLRKDEDYTTRFEREAQAIAQLQHPHIVNVYRYGEDDGVVYMAMQYIEGADLGTVLDSYQVDNDYMESDEILSIVEQLASALDYAHRQGVIHRDIKPSNVMLDKSGNVYLTDFGLALLTDIGTQGEIFGSPHYIAPEQAMSSAAVVPQSDIYGLGVMLFEMFTNTLPFEDEDPMELAMKHMSAPPPMPGNLREGLSPAVEKVIMKALAKKPDDRYQTTQELADALQAALGDAPTQDTPLSRHSVVERVEFEMEQNPLPVIPAAVAATPPEPPPVEMTQRAQARRGDEVPPQATQPAATVPGATIPGAAIPAEPPPSQPLATGGIPMWAFMAGGAAIVLMCVILIAGGALLLGGGDDDDEPTTIPTRIETALAEDLTVTATALTPSPTTTNVPASSTPFILAPTQAPSLTAAIPTPTTAPSLTPPSQPGGGGDVRFAVTLVEVDNGNAVFAVNDYTTNFPLNSFTIVHNDFAFSGSGWGIDQLAPGQCVRVWRLEAAINNINEREDQIVNQLPGCNQMVGTRRTLQGAEVFWTSTYEVVFPDGSSRRCGADLTECPVRIR